MNWVDQDKDPAPQWVGDMACRESKSVMGYNPADYRHTYAAFQALCRRIYRTEAPPVDPDFERMRRAVAAYEARAGYPALAKLILSGDYDDRVQAALNASNEIVAS